MMQLKYILGLLFVCSFLFASAQNKVERHMNAREGDQAYTKGAFQDAEIKYREANQLERKSTTTYNLGNSVFQQERYEEAVKHFQDAVEEATDPQLKAQAYHNLGNAHLSNENLEEGVKSYIESLKLNPDDMDTKKNLTMALQKLEQQRQQQQQQQEQQNQEQQEQEQQEQQQQDPSQQPQQQPQQGEEEMPQDAQPQEEKRDLSKEEAEELLKIIEDEDQKVQEKLRKTSGEKKKPKKDW